LEGKVILNNQGLVQNLIFRNFNNQLEESALTKEAFKSEIEASLLDMIRTYDKSKNDSFSAYIQGFLPLRIPAIFQRYNTTDETGEVVYGKKLSDEGAQQIASDETYDSDSLFNENEEVMQPTIRLAKKLGIDAELKEVINDIVKKTLSRRLPSVDSKEFKNALIKEFREDIKLPLFKFFGRRKEYTKHIDKHWRTIFEAMPVANLARRMRPLIDPVLDANGKQKRETHTVDGNGNGNPIWTKQYVTKERFMDHFVGPKVGASTVGTRKTALAETLSTELAYDIVLDILSTENTVSSRFKEIQEMQDFKVVEDTLLDIAHIVGRDPSVVVELKNKEANKASRSVMALPIAERQNIVGGFGKFMNNVRVFAKNLSGNPIKDAFYRTYLNSRDASKMEYTKEQINDMIDSFSELAGFNYTSDKNWSSEEMSPNLLKKIDNKVDKINTKKYDNSLLNSDPDVNASIAKVLNSTEQIDIDTANVEVQKMMAGIKSAKAVKAKNIKVLKQSTVYSKSYETKPNTEVLETLGLIDNSIKSARKSRRTPGPVKVLKTFNFDDTLAITDTMIGYTKKDGTKGNITTALFASRGEKMMNEGTKFDFTEMHKEFKGEAGPMINVLRKMVDKRGGDHIFILTSRPAVTAPFIQAFLKSQGVEMKLENIIGDQDTATKNLWFMDQIFNGYNDIFYVDNNLQATRDVDALLLSYPIDHRSSRVGDAITQHNKEMGVKPKKSKEETVREEEAQEVENLENEEITQEEPKRKKVDQKDLKIRKR